MDLSDQWAREGLLQTTSLSGREWIIVLALSLPAPPPSRWTRSSSYDASLRPSPLRART
jgi:hypothetical protein